MLPALCIYDPKVILGFSNIKNWTEKEDLAMETVPFCDIIQ